MMTSKQRVTYTDEEIAAITTYANSSVEKDGKDYTNAARDAAVEAHRALLTRVRLSRGELPYKDLHFEFMREVDTPVPDYGLKATYRKQITTAFVAGTQPRSR
ncbi:hypothetical protein ACVIGB_000593 [Bradyrhizobium sp. USDA 4341]